MKKLISATVAALGIAASASAIAGPTFFFPQTLFEDDLIDFFVDNNSNGLIDIGDRVLSVVEVYQTAPVFGGGSAVSIAPPEYTGILDTVVATKTSAGGNLFNFTFAPNPTYLSGAGLSAPVLAQATAGGVTPGTFIRFWDGPVDNLDLVGPNCSSLSDCADRASDGTLYFEFGFNGDANEHFQILGASDDPEVVHTTAAGVQLGSANFGWNILTNNSGVNFAPLPCVGSSPFCPAGGDGKIDVLGSGQINGGLGLTNEGFARGDFQLTMAPIPEPASLALLGIGLLGIGATRRMKRS